MAKPTNLDPLLSQLGNTLFDALPNDWDTATVDAGLDEDYGELLVVYRDADGTVHDIDDDLAEDILDILEAIRSRQEAAGDEPAAIATYHLNRDGRFTIDFQYGDIETLRPRPLHRAPEPTFGTPDPGS